MGQRLQLWGEGRAGSRDSGPCERPVALCACVSVRVQVCEYVGVSIYDMRVFVSVHRCESACELQAAALAGPPWKCRVAETCPLGSG